jgi:hypothetical protein
VRIVLIILPILYVLPTYAQVAYPTGPSIPISSFRTYSDGEALDITTKALLKEPTIKRFVKNSEELLWMPFKYAGISEKVVRTTATIAAPLIAGKISTNGLNVGWKPKKDFQIRPDVDYYFKDGTSNYNLNLNWEF